MTPPPPPPIGLAELEGVRRLARVLVRGDADAEDLAQDAVVVALMRPPRPGYAPRAWLAGIARRLARNRSREGARRARHEAAAATEAACAPALDVTEHVERRRRVLEAVAALPEDAAQVVCLRYFDDLPPREIAARLGLPVETVRTRTKRALARLREDLDRREGGDGAAWSALLLPLAGRPDAPPPPGLTEGLAMASTTKILTLSAAALLLAGGGWFAWRMNWGPQEAPGTAPQAPVAARPLDPADLAGRPRAASTRGEVASADPGRPQGAASSASDGGVADGASLSGRVVGPGGMPVVGARVRLRPESALPGYLRVDLARRWSLVETRTDAEGRWALQGIRPGDGYAIVVDAEGFAPAFAASSWRAREVAAVADLALDAGTAATGRVVDGDGRPVPGARVAALLPETNPLAFVLASIDAHAALQGLATSDADGRFRLDHLGGPQVVLVVEHAGHATVVAKVAVGGGPTTPLADLVLPPAGTISGHARFGDGAPAVGARVLVMRDDGASAYAADVASDGAFRIEAVPPGVAPVIGFLPGLTPVFGPEARTGTGGVELRFPRPGRLVGRVVSAADGKPVPRFRVRPVPSESAPDFMADFAEKSVAKILGPVEVSDGDGRFTVEPIEPRSYRVDVEAAGFASGSVGPVEVPAAADSAPVEVRLAASASLHGALVDGEGKPVAGAMLLAEAGGTSWAAPPAPKEDGITIVIGETRPEPVAVASGTDGVFSFPALPAGPQGLTIRAPGYAPWFRGAIDVTTVREPLRVVLARGGSVAGTVTVGGNVPTTVRSVLLVGPLGNLEAPIGEGGTFRAEHVPAGRWLLLPAVGTPVLPLVEAAHDELVRALGAADVDVEDGAELRRTVAATALGSLEVRPEPSTDARTVTIEGASAHRLGRGPEGGAPEVIGPFVHQGQRAPDGSMSMRDLLPGTYEVSTFYSVKGRDAEGHGVESIAQAKVRVEVGSDPRPVQVVVPPQK